MYNLITNDCDNYPHISESWKKKPTEDQLRKFVSDYYENEATVDRVVEDLMTHGEADVGDSSCTTYTLDKS